MLTLLRSHALPDDMHPGAASADGRRFVAYSEGGGCVLFDDGLREVGRVRASGEPRWAQLSGDGSLLLVGLDDRIVELLTEFTAEARRHGGGPDLPRGLAKGPFGSGSCG